MDSMPSVKIDDRSLSSCLHSGYGHPLTRRWQAERQLSKVRLSDEV